MRVLTADNSHLAISTAMSARIGYRKVSPETMTAMAGREGHGDQWREQQQYHGDP